MRHNPQTHESSPACPLCQSPSVFFLQTKAYGQAPANTLELQQVRYFRCCRCEAPFLDPAMRLNEPTERQRYEMHDNNLKDAGYQEFLRPLVDLVRKQEQSGARGLDFGCGPTLTMKTILAEHGFVMSAFDPFFANDPGVFEQNFDFIVSSEVFEHLYDPRAEIKKLRSVLKPGGVVYIMTSSFEGDASAFESWYYRRDPAHVVFYTVQGLTVLAQDFAFEEPIAWSKKIFSLKAK